jgi:hypothetical protein
MIKILGLYMITTLMLIVGCNSKHDELKMAEKVDVYLNGTLLNLNNDNLSAVIKETDNLLAECDGVMDVNNTIETIRKLKGSEQFLEIDFTDDRYIMTDKFGKIEYRRILIPLSGPLAVSGQLTVFYGREEYSAMPMVNRKGFQELNELLIGLEYL